MRDLQAYKDALASAQSWLKDARETINRSDNCSGDKETIVSRLNALKVTIEINDDHVMMLF